MPPRQRRRHRKGLAIPVEELGCEANLLAEFYSEIPFTLGAQDDECQGCGAYHWRAERRISDKNLEVATFSNCCQQGDVELPLAYFDEDIDEPTPAFFLELLTGTDERKSCFNTCYL